MSKNKLALEIVNNLRQLAKSIETFLEEIQPDENTLTATPQKSEPITLETVRGVLASRSQGGKQPEVKALITKYGAKKLTDIDPARYEDLLKEAEVM
ncbi:rRNA biogenesis protein rrp5 [Clostridium vincentii]|uniref:rRNA biogenesis protein rrp5 n=1 Tax=Clostridium vincentii TaxID=52704 RepID=A0A2T0BL34_9CLOT|nr:rRNA biogenesis protein rrp5 [Clostridium vincentii]PRR84553.1 hypothetical protein CLVI_00760 [Clostridium vincentii]